MGRMHLVMALLMLVGFEGAARADVLCKKASGAVMVRDACRRREQALDLSRFVGPGPQGPQGPQGPAGLGPLSQCPPDEVLVGPTCVDKYEASVWQIDPSNAALIAKVRAGTVTLADLTSAGATPLCPGRSEEDLPSNFPPSGQWTSLPGVDPPSPGVYAVSVAGAIPTQCTTWFQAGQACRLSGKRLLTNLEWQDAAAGTPDPGTDDGTADCAVTWENGFVPTGSRARCVSAWGTYDMVGNAGEWVADWADEANDCADWTGMAGTLPFAGGDRLPGHDSMCFGGTGNLNDGLTSLRGIPGPLVRGVAGDALGGPAYMLHAGVFAVTSHTLPFVGNGFRCGR
ncbi:MAG: SUMF1/EgtB/PvdO family nonheme iron enzyme [Candidatus Binatia bacterium]